MSFIKTNRLPLGVLLGCSLIFSALFGLFLRADPIEQEPARLIYLVGMAIAMLVLYGVSFWLAQTRIPNRKLGSLASYVVALILVPVLFFVGAEFLFSQRDRSNSVGYSLAGKRWFARHWKPFNRYEYRDDDFSLESIRDKKVISVLGDSFIAGHGIADYRDRFSNQLQGKLPDQYKVINLGHNGRDSRALYQALMDFPRRPDILVLSYFGNDIKEAAMAAGMSLAPYEPYNDLSRLTKAIIKASFFLDWIYWSQPRPDLTKWWDYLQTAYSNEEIRKAHIADLKKFVDFTQQNHVPMIVVLFPYLHNPPSSDVYVPFIRDLFASWKIPLIDVQKMTAGMSIEETIVNTNDVHASVKVNTMIADELHSLLTRRELVAPSGAVKPATSNQPRRP